MTSDIKFFEEYGEQLHKKIEELEIKNRRLSTLRLVFFLMTAGSAVFAFVHPPLKILLLIASSVCLIVFIWLCVIHGRSKALYSHYQILEDIDHNYVHKINGKFAKLTDNDEPVKTTDHDYALDLDVFGDVSLFNLYNISETYLGRKEFAEELLGKHHHDDIVERQKACEELISKAKFLMEFQAVARENKMRVMPALLTEFYSDSKPFDKRLRTLYKILPCLWLIPLILALTVPGFVGVGIMSLMIINLIVWFLVSSRYADKFVTAAALNRQAGGYAKLYSLCEEQGFENELNKKLVKGGAGEGKKASEGIRSLSAVCSLCAVRSQPMLAFLINAGFPYDLICADKLLSWAHDHGNELKEDLESMSKFEALMCCCSVGIISRESTFPEVTEGAVFEGDDITHPLLDPSKAVSNSISLKAGTALITGSNMSGKTTLIRTVGIMCVLAYTGAPVPAKYVKAGRMRVMSSMRIVDSIEEQMSTFRAELVRIAKIVEAGKEEKPLLFLIDEIFRGTNSADRTEGALKVIENLDRPHIMGLMTTHDYALCDKVTETVKSVVYYHFSEKYNDDGITFDYKLHNGVSHESNAKFLMRLVGIY